jgi:hypothetical protein
MARKNLFQRLFRMGHAEPEPALEVAGDSTAAMSSESKEDAAKDTEVRIERAADSTGTKTAERKTLGSSRLPAEEVPPPVPARQVSKKEEMAQKLTDGFDNLSMLLKGVNLNLESSSSRAEKLASDFEGLPGVLKSIPETNRAQIEFLGAISRQLDVQNSRNTELVDSLKSLPDLLEIIPEGNRVQTEQLAQIADHINSNSKTQLQQFQAVQKAQDATFVALRNSQNKSITLVTKSQEAALSVFKQSQASQARQIQTLIDRTQKSLNKTLMVAAGLISAGVIIAAALAILL